MLLFPFSANGLCLIHRGLFSSQYFFILLLKIKIKTNKCNKINKLGKKPQQQFLFVSLNMSNYRQQAAHLVYPMNRRHWLEKFITPPAWAFSSPFSDEMLLIVQIGNFVSHVWMAFPCLQIFWKHRAWDKSTSTLPLQINVDRN